MDDALKLADPPIFMNWRGDFNMGQFPRYREQKLSRIIYHLNRKKKEPTTESVQAVVYSSGREIVENLRRTFMPNYMERRAEEQRRALEETMRLGPEGLRNLDERLDEMLTTPMTASEMEHTPRVSNMGTITEESMRDAITAMRNNTGPTPAEIAASRRWIEEAEDARRNRIQVQTRPDGTHWFREYMPDIAEPTITPITIGTDLSFKERNN